MEVADRAHAHRQKPERQVKAMGFPQAAKQEAKCLVRRAQKESTDTLSEGTPTYLLSGGYQTDLNEGEEGLLRRPAHVL